MEGLGEEREVEEKKGREEERKEGMKEERKQRMKKGGNEVERKEE